jgi:hypothetical protein
MILWKGNYLENIFYTWKTSRGADDMSVSALTGLERLQKLRASATRAGVVYTVADARCFPYFVTSLLCLTVRHLLNKL